MKLFQVWSLLNVLVMIRTYWHEISFTFLQVISFLTQKQEIEIHLLSMKNRTGAIKQLNRFSWHKTLLSKKVVEATECQETHAQIVWIVHMLIFSVKFLFNFSLRQSFRDENIVTKKLSRLGKDVRIRLIIWIVSHGYWNITWSILCQFW